MGHLNGRERLYHDPGVTLLEAPKHLRVVRQLQLGMEPAHDVELARRILAGGVGLGKDFLEAARIRAVFLRHARERAEHARVAQDANVGRIDVLVRREVYAAAVPALVGGKWGGGPARTQEGRRDETTRAAA